MGPLSLLRAEPKPSAAAPAGAPGAASRTPALVQLRGVGRRYGRLVALRDVDLTIAPGEFVFVVGPSEAGKTTLLKLIHGDLRPHRGRIRVEDFRLNKRWRRFLPRLRREVGIVFQDHRLLDDMTARGNVAFALQVANLWLPHGEVRARAQSRLEEVGLDGRPNAHPRELSGGQQRRLAIARALVNDPPLLLADEPTANLDRRNAELVMDLLERRCRAGTAVVVATHDLELTRTRPYRMIELREGRVIADRPARIPMPPAPIPAAWAKRRQPKWRFLEPFRRLTRTALGYQPPPRPLSPPPALPAPNGAWSPPPQVAELPAPAVATQLELNGFPRPADTLLATVPAVPAHQAPVNGNGRDPMFDEPVLRRLRRKLKLGRRLGRAAQVTLGYTPAPERALPVRPRRRLRVRARIGRSMQVVLGYTPAPPPLFPSRPRSWPWTPLANLGRLVVGGAFASWFRNFRLAAPALGSISLLLLLAGVIAVSGFAVRTLLDFESSEASILHVYLADDATQDQVDQARQQLASLPNVRSVHYLDKDAALARARQRPGLSDLAAASDSNPFPASYDVQVDQPGHVGAVAAAAGGAPGVDQKRPTSYDEGTYQRLRQFTVIAAAVAGGFGFLLLLVTYVITSNSIRTVVLARRAELLTMQLVGASSWLVRCRLGVEGALTGALAGLIASLFVVGVCVGAYYGARHLFLQVLPGVTAVTAAEVVGAIVVIGLGLGAVSALFALRRLRT